jgi:hypothetical protein
LTAGRPGVEREFRPGGCVAVHCFAKKTSARRRREAAAWRVFLYRKNRLYYVGLASNIRSRLNSQLRDRFRIYLTVGDEHLRELESLVMRISSPKGNRQKGKFSRSEDLKRRFRRQVALYQRVELNRLFGFTKRFIDGWHTWKYQRAPGDWVQLDELRR